MNLQGPLRTNKSYPPAVTYCKHISRRLRVWLTQFRHGVLIRVGVRDTFMQPIQRSMRYIDDEWVCTFKGPFRTNNSYPPESTQCALISRRLPVGLTYFRLGVLIRVGVRGTFMQPIYCSMRFIQGEWVCTFKDPLRTYKSYPPVATYCKNISRRLRVGLTQFRFGFLIRVVVRGTYIQPIQRIMRYIDDEWVCTFKCPFRTNKSFPPIATQCRQISGQLPVGLT